jgi:hypothetical protein
LARSFTVQFSKINSQEHLAQDEATYKPLFCFHVNSFFVAVRWRVSHPSSNEAAKYRNQAMLSTAFSESVPYFSLFVQTN